MLIIFRRSKIFPTATSPSRARTSLTGRPFLKFLITVFVFALRLIYAKHFIKITHKLSAPIHSAGEIYDGITQLIDRDINLIGR